MRHLGLHPLGAGEQVGGLGDEHVVAGGQDDGHAHFTGQRAVQAGLAQFHAVDEDAREGEAVDGVRQDAAALRARVVADHEDGVAALFQAAHHAQVARLAQHQAGAFVEAVRQQVAETAVRIVDQDLFGAAGDGALHGGVGLGGHPGAGAFVFAVACAHLFGVEDAGDAFDIGGNQDLHGVCLRRIQNSVSASHWRQSGAASRMAAR